MTASDVGGYVLAGGQSTRMGQDKAMLTLAEKPLVLHAVTKLRRVCADLNILGSRSELEAFAPLVRDIHEGCGPIGGLEAALEHSRHEWNLFMPVDVPFLPSAFLEAWVREVTASQKKEARVALFTVDRVPQPLFCLLHREIGPFVSEAVRQGNYKVFPVLFEAARELAKRQKVGVACSFLNKIWDGTYPEFLVGSNESAIASESWRRLTRAQEEAKQLWFANLNTRQEFAKAEEHLNALDT